MIDIHILRKSRDGSTFCFVLAGYRADIANAIGEDNARRGSLGRG
jgi:hypothetical protein